MTLRQIETEDFTVSFDDTAELRNQVFEKILNFFKDLDSFNGESMIQSDLVHIEGPSFLATLAENDFKFKVECK